MPEKADSFLDKVRKDQVKPPTKRGFSPEKWNAEFAKSDPIEDQSLFLYRAGIFVNNVLSHLRSELEEVVNEIKAYQGIEILKLYIAISNRERRTLSNLTDSMMNGGGKGRTVASTSFQGIKIKNRYDQDMSVSEISIACIDCFENAIKRALNDVDKCGSEKPTDKDSILIKILREADISQIYADYQGKFTDILWGDFEFHEDNRDIIFSQKDNEEQRHRVVSFIRNEKLAMDRAALSRGPIIDVLFADHVSINVSGSGKSKKYVSVKFRDMELSSRGRYIALRTGFDAACDIFPENILDMPIGENGYTLNDIKTVFISYAMLASQIFQNMPEDDGFFSVSKLRNFCPSIDKRKACISIAKATGISLRTVLDVTDFLAYKGEQGQDIWRYPFISTSGGKIYPLLTALLDAVPLRCIEGWLQRLEIPLDTKGDGFERILSIRLREKFKSQSLIKRYSVIASKEHRYNGESEEIDLIINIGNSVIVVEQKCIVTTDSPISYYRSMSTLYGASEQAKRKADFISDNIEEFISQNKLDWVLRDNVNVVPLVVCSNNLCSGLEINGVTISDPTIILSYLNSGKFSMFSIGKKDKISNAASLVLYEDEYQAAERFGMFLKNPPQIQVLLNYLKQESFAAPTPGNNQKKTVCRRLVHDNPYSYEELLSFDFGFELRFEDGFSVDDIKKISNII